MPWQHGTFVRLYSWVSDAAAGFDIGASRMDDDTNDIVAGLNHCLTLDGQNPATSLTLDGPLTASGLASLNGGLAWTGGATGDTLTLTGPAPQITLNNGTSNWLQWPAAGIGPPTLGTRSLGTKLMLYPTEGAGSCDYAIGIQAGAIWFSAAAFNWYGGTTALAMSLDGSGNLTAEGQIAAAGAIVAGAGIAAGGAITAGAFSYFTGGVAINGGSSLVGGLTVDSFVVTTNATIEGQLNLSGGGYALTIYPGGFNVNGSSSITGDLSVNGGGYGISVPNGSINVGGQIVGASLLISGAASISGNATVVGSLAVNADAVVSGAVTVGNLRATGSLEVDGSIVCSNGLLTIGAGGPGADSGIVCNGTFVYDAETVQVGPGGSGPGGSGRMLYLA